MSNLLSTFIESPAVETTAKSIFLGLTNGKALIEANEKIAIAKVEAQREIVALQLDKQEASAIAEMKYKTVEMLLNSDKVTPEMVVPVLSGVNELFK